MKTPSWTVAAILVASTVLNVQPAQAAVHVAVASSPATPMASGSMVHAVEGFRQGWWCRLTGLC